MISSCVKGTNESAGVGLPHTWDPLGLASGPVLYHDHYHKSKSLQHGLINRHLLFNSKSKPTTTQQQQKRSSTMMSVSLVDF